jgi:hypothetical protein
MLNRISFHKHQWQLISKTYSPPIPDEKWRVSGSPINDEQIDLLKGMTHGRTEFIFTCALCLELKKESLFGKEVVDETI